MKTNKRKSFVVYTGWRECFELLDDSEKAQMLMNLFDYHEGIEPVLNTKSLQIAWSVIKPLLKINTEKYQNQVGRAMNNVQKRKTDVVTTSSDVVTASSRPRVSNDNDNVNGNGNAIVDETVIVDGTVIVDDTGIVDVDNNFNEKRNSAGNDNTPSGFLTNRFKAIANLTSQKKKDYIDQINKLGEYEK